MPAFPNHLNRNRRPPAPTSSPPSTAGASLHVTSSGLRKWMGAERGKRRGWLQKGVPSQGRPGLGPPAAGAGCRDAKACHLEAGADTGEDGREDAGHAVRQANAQVGLVDQGVSSLAAQEAAGPAVAALVLRAPGPAAAECMARLSLMGDKGARRKVQLAGGRHNAGKGCCCHRSGSAAATAVHSAPPSPSTALSLPRTRPCRRRRSGTWYSTRSSRWRPGSGHPPQVLCNRKRRCSA